MKGWSGTVVLLVTCVAAWVGLTPAQARAETLSDMFSSGVSAFRAGRFDEAAKTFEQLHGRYEVSSPDLLVNLGAAQFRAGLPGKALVYLHRAVRTAPSTPAADLARVNLERIRASLNQKEESRGQGFVFGAYHDVWTALFGGMSVFMTAVLFLLSWAALFGLLGSRRLVRSQRVRRSLSAAAIPLVAMTVILGVCAYGTSRVADYRIGVVTATQAGLYDDVSALNPSMILPEAVEGRVIETRGNFMRIRLSSGREGFVQDQVLGIP